MKDWKLPLMETARMQSLTTPLLGRACRIFLSLAYADGPDSIPAKKRQYFDLPADQPLSSFLPPADGAAGICQEVRKDGELCGYEFRLGSTSFPHLKLRVQNVEHNGQPALVFMVDTHDAFSKSSPHPPPNHPDAARWLEIQRVNRELKEKIEAALEANGLVTLNALLRGDLPPSGGEG